MKISNRSMLTAVFMTLMSADAAMSKAEPTTLVIGPDLLVDVTISNNAARLQLLSYGPSMLLLNPDAAKRFGAKGGLFGGQAKVGPVVIKGQTTAMSFVIDGQSSRGRVGWFDRAISSTQDGAFGPMSVPQDIVTVQLRAAQAGERRFELPMINQGNGSVGTNMTVNGQKLLIQFDLNRPENLATSAAGTALAEAHNGQFSEKSQPTVIAFGIERPVRTMLLGRAFEVGPLTLDRIVTRTSDYGDTSNIVDADADPSEIVVTGRGKKSKAIYTLQIGRDAMRDCSSLTFDKPRKLIILNCSLQANRKD
jgi:hypothetical protein